MAVPVEIFAVLPQTEQFNFWAARKRMCFAVPEFQALHHAVTGQWNVSAAFSPADDLTDLQRLCLAVAIVDYDAVKLDWRVLNANLEKAVASGSSADFNIVMVVLAVNMRLAKINLLRVGRGWSEINQHCQGEN
jgi:hypothetical protein